MKRWFLELIGCEVTTLGRVGVDVILAAPLPRIVLPAPGSEQLDRQLVRLDGQLTLAFTGLPYKFADPRWKH